MKSVHKYAKELGIKSNFKTLGNLKEKQSLKIIPCGYSTEDYADILLSYEVVFFVAVVVTETAFFISNSRFWSTMDLEVYTEILY